MHRGTGPWAQTVHSLLKHLEAEGFDGAPRVIGTGFDDNGTRDAELYRGRDAGAL